MTRPDRPAFGKAAGKPPSWFARVPTKAIWEVTRGSGRTKSKVTRGLSPGNLHVLCCLCAYANNQGFTWPGRKTIAATIGVDPAIVTKALKKAETLGYIKKVSKHRSEPKWRHVYGTVWRIIHDDGMTDEELVDRMNHDDPAPIQEEDLPAADKTITDKQDDVLEGNELVDVVCGTRMAWWFARLVGDRMGVVRLVNPRAVKAAAKALELHGGDEARLKARAEKRVAVCLAERRDPPHHLGWLT